ncbi:MAG: IS66 family transposase [Egibacteraceae bacterium]
MRLRDGDHRGVPGRGGRAGQLLGDLLGTPIAVGTVANVTAQAAAAAAPAVEAIREQVAAAPVAHFDETGTGVAGRGHWTHVACTDQPAHYHVDAERGRVGMDAAGVLPAFSGVAVHDGWKPYCSYPQVTHGLCSVHFLGALRAAVTGLWRVRCVVPDRAAGSGDRRDAQASAALVAFAVGALLNCAGGVCVTASPSRRLPRGSPSPDVPPRPGADPGHPGRKGVNGAEVPFPHVSGRCARSQCFVGWPCRDAGAPHPWRRSAS